MENPIETWLAAAPRHQERVLRMLNDNACSWSRNADHYKSNRDFSLAESSQELCEAFVAVETLLKDIIDGASDE
jgi:hypothetical protein